MQFRVFGYFTYVCNLPELRLNLRFYIIYHYLSWQHWVSASMIMVVTDDVSPH